MNKYLLLNEHGAAEQPCLSQHRVWQRNDLAQPQLDWLAEEVLMALVYNGISSCGDDGYPERSGGIRHRFNAL